MSALLLSSSAVLGVLCPSSGLRFSPSVLSAPLALYARVTRLVATSSSPIPIVFGQVLEGVLCSKTRIAQPESNASKIVHEDEIFGNRFMCFILLCLQSHRRGF